MAVKSNDRLADLVVSRFKEASLYRQQSCGFGGKSIDYWLFATERAYNKVHEAEETKQWPEMQGYFGFINLKIDAAADSLKTKYAHAVESPFVFNPSTNPELSDAEKKQISKALEDKLRGTMQGSGLVFDPAGSDRSVLTNDRVLRPEVQKWLSNQSSGMTANIREMALQKAREAAGYHQSFVKAQLSNRQSGWANAANNIFTNFVMKPYVCVAANEVRSVADEVWDGNKAVYKTRKIPTFRHVRSEDLYMAPDCTNAQDGAGVTEIINRPLDKFTELKDLESLGYKPAAIDKVLADRGRSDWSNGWMYQGVKTLDVQGYGNQKHGITCLIHQGLLSGKELSDYGITGHGSKTNEFFNVAIECVGNTTIRCQVLQNGNGRRNYYSAAYKTNGSSYAGISVAMKLFDRQLELNRLMLTKAKNQWYSSAPSYNVNSQYYDHASEFSLEPYSINYSKPNINGTPSGRPADQLIVPAMYRMLHQEIRDTMILGDEESGVPALFSGLSRGGVSRTTLGGAVLEQTNGEVGMNGAIINLDTTMIGPLFTHLHFQNLMSKEIPKEYVRGDINVIGRGIYGLKEVELKNRLQMQAIPSLRQDAMQGIVPKQTLTDALTEYYTNAGINMQALPSSQAQAELAAQNTNPPVMNDGRTYNPQQQTTGLMQ